MNTVIDNVLAQTNAWENPYFVALRDGSLSRDDFVETQVQFYFAVSFFSRPMAAVAAKIPVPDQRVEVLRNVWEEHGEGTPSLMHGETFLEFLERLGDLTPDDVARRTLWPEVRAFNTTLVGACVMDEYLVGVACLGIIERLFSDISAWIGEGIVQREWLSAETLVHYTLHRELDVRHSDDFFNVLRPAWDNGSDDRYVIEQGFQLGAYAFDRMYRDLYAARARRRESRDAGPHSLHSRI